MGKLGHVGDDFVGEAVGKSGEVGIAAAVFEGKDRNPEAFVFADCGGSSAGTGSSQWARGSCQGGRTVAGRGGDSTDSREIAKFVTDVARGLHAVARIFLEAAADEAGEIGRKIGAQLGDGRLIVAEDGGGEFGGGVTGERAAAGAHFVEENAEGKDVGAMVERAAGNLFGRHVGGRAHDDTDLGLSGSESG